MPAFLFLPKFWLYRNLQNVHSALKLLPQLVGILRITEQRSRNRCSVHDSSSHQSDTPYTPPWSASTEGHFLPTRPVAKSHTFAGSHPVFLSKHGGAFFAYPTGSGIAHVCWFAPGFPQQVPPAPFLPTRPVAKSHTFAGSHPVFLSKYRQHPFYLPDRQRNHTRLLVRTRFSSANTSSCLFRPSGRQIQTSYQHTFAGSHPVFLSEHLQLPFPPLRPTNTNLISKTKQPMDGQHVFLLPIHGLSFSFILRRRCPARSPRR